jgi:hypothetical protein
MSEASDYYSGLIPAVTQPSKPTASPAPVVSKSGGGGGSAPSGAGGHVITRQDVIDQYMKYVGRAPTEDEIRPHVGQTVPDINVAAANFFGVGQAPSGGGGFEFPDFGELFGSFGQLSDEEKGLLKTQTDLIKLQMEDLKRQNSLNAELFPLQKQLYEFQLKFATELFPQQKAMIEQAIADMAPTENSKEITRLSEERALASLRGEPIPLSAAQQAQLDTVYGEAGQRGARDLRQFAEEMGAARGLHLTDTPIGDVALREAQNLFAGLEASKAQASLDLGQSQQVFSEGVRQFQSGLQQQALQNRLSLASGASNQPSLGAVNASPLIGSFQGTLASLSQNRASAGQLALGAAGLGLQQQQYQQGILQANLDRISRERIAQFGAGQGYGGGGSSTLNTISSLAPVAASALNFGASFPWSSARFKKDITPLDADEFAAAADAHGLPIDAYEDALGKLRETPITRWRYHWEPDDSQPHIGPILELAPKELSADGLQVNLLDYAGLLHAGLKAVDRKVQRLVAEVG